MRISIFGDVEYGLSFVSFAKQFHKKTKRRSKLRPHFYYGRANPKEDLAVISRPWMDDIAIFARVDEPIIPVEPRYDEERTWQVVERLSGLSMYAACGSGLGLISMFNSINSFNYETRKRSELSGVFVDGPIYGSSVLEKTGDPYFIRPANELGCFDVVMVESSSIPGSENGGYGGSTWKKRYDTEFFGENSNHGNSVLTISSGGTLRYSGHEGDYVYGEIGQKRVATATIGYDSNLNISVGCTLRSSKTFGMVPQDTFFYVGPGHPSTVSQTYSKKRAVIRLSDRVLLTGSFSYENGPLRVLQDDESHPIFGSDIIVNGFFELFGLTNSGDITRKRIDVVDRLVVFPENGPEMYSGSTEFDCPVSVDELFQIMIDAGYIDGTPGPDLDELYDWFVHGVYNYSVRSALAIFGGASGLASGQSYENTGFNFCGHSIISISDHVLQFDGTQFLSLPYTRGEADSKINSIRNAKNPYTGSRTMAIGTDFQLVEKYSKELDRFIVANHYSGEVDTTILAISYSMYDALTLELLFETDVIGESEGTQHWACDILYGGAHRIASVGYPRIFCSDNMQIIAVYYLEYAGAVFRIGSDGVSTKIFDLDTQSVDPIFIHDDGLVVATKEKIWIHKSLCGHSVIADGAVIECVDCAGMFYDYKHFVDHVEDGVFQIKKINYFDMSVTVVDQIFGCNYFELSVDSSIGLYAKAFASEIEEGFTETAPVYIVDFIDGPFNFESSDIDRTFLFPEYLYGVDCDYLENIRFGYKRRFPYGRRSVSSCYCAYSQCDACGERRLESVQSGRLSHVATCDVEAPFTKGVSPEYSDSVKRRHIVASSYIKRVKTTGLRHASMAFSYLGGADACPYIDAAFVWGTSPELLNTPNCITGQFSDGFMRRRVYTDFYKDKRFNKFMVVSGFADNRRSTDVATRYNEEVLIIRRRLDNLDNIEGEKLPHPEV